ncbi:MAG: right-handed parallel beta-helix repeat-containing protein [Burkholderiaceae bacterium]|nr:right-handed parallel beta-helix repeat-containing protein [Burkholderiaceae bacterium]
MYRWPHLPGLTLSDSLARGAAALLTLGAALVLPGCGGGGDASTEAVSVENASTTSDEQALVQASRVRGRFPLPVASVTAPVVPTVPTATSYTGRAWFVDATAGSDTGAGSSAAPWKTLARAAKQTLAAGDAVLLKCGSIWRESFTLNSINAPAGGAIVGAWGTCSSTNRPIISGADTVSGVTWTVAPALGGKPVYVAPWSKAVTALYWNGTPLVRARYPNFGGIGHEFGLIASVRNGKTLVTGPADAALLGSTNLSGAKAFIRTNPWLVESHDIASSDSSGAVTLNALATYAPQAGQGYFVEGKLALLDTAGEWFHDPATGLLYVWTPTGASPASGVLETVERNVGVSVSKVADVRIDKLAFERHRQQSLYIVDGQRTAVTEVSSLDAGLTGILIEGGSAAQSTGTSVERSVISNAGGMGISVDSSSVRIVGNQIDNTGVGAAGTGVSAGVYIKSVGGTVQDNRISNSAFAAIVLSHATGSTVSGNTLLQACKRFTDCGAIYSGGAPSLAQRTQISSNAISDMAPNPEGAIGGATTLVAGIYLDEESATHDVVNNMISRVGVGINLHNSANHTVQSNRIWLVDRAAVRVHNSSAVETVRGNVIQDNELYASSHLTPSVPATTAPVSRDVYAQEWVHGSNAALMFAGTNPNIVRRNVVGTMSAPAAVRWSLLGGWNHQTLDATQWSAYATGDSVKSAYAARPFLITSGGANLVQNGALQNPGTAWMFWSPTPAAGGKLTFGTCSTGCADFAPGSNSDFAMSSTFRMSSAAGSSLHRLRVRALGLAPGVAVTMAINRDGGDWGQLGFVLMNQALGSTGETVIDALFNATSSDNGRLNMSGLSGKSLRLRDVTIEQISSYELFAPSRESTLLVNETAVSKSVDCPSGTLRTCVVSDLAGQAVTWPVTLAPNTAKVVLSADSKWKPAL